MPCVADRPANYPSSSSSMHLGLSVSHDSVFHSPNSGSDIDLDAAQSSSSLSACQPHMDCRLQTELNARLRLRRGREDNSEDDEGFPYSSCNSPTTSDGLLLDKTANKSVLLFSVCLYHIALGTCQRAEIRK
nr:unnamed protein product [Callosobruchus chinensis]